MNVLKANGQVLHFSDEGPSDGPAVVFSNSLGTDFRVWDPLMPHLPDSLRIIRYDKRGHGLSSCPKSPYTIEDHRDDIAGLLDGLAIERTAFVGLSVGGMIGQALSAARPDLVKALVLCDTGHVIGPPSVWEDRFRAIEAGGIGAMSDGILQRWFSARFHAERPDELQLWRAMLTRTPVEGYLGTCRAIQSADLTEAASNLAMPTICVVGSEDGATTPELMRSTAELIGADLHEIDGAGHLPCVETPEALAAIVLPFLKENGFA
ncbi:MAG: 3-oxoadipate enol-lactonase [Pseudomonadota bacterium]